MEYVTLGREIFVSDIPLPDGYSIAVVEYEIPQVIANGVPTDGLGYRVAEILAAVNDEKLSEQHGRPVSGSVMPPDVWLMAIAVLVWEGIVQGMSWDITKSIIQDGIARMQS